MSEENDIKTAEPQNAAYLSLLMSEIAQVALKKSPITKCSDEEMTRISRRLRKEIIIYEEYWKEFISKQPIYMILVNKVYENRVVSAIKSIKNLPSEIKNESDRQALHSALRKINIAANALVRLQQTQIQVLEAENYSLKNNGGSVTVTEDFLNKALAFLHEKRDAVNIANTVDGILEQVKEIHDVMKNEKNDDIKTNVNKNISDIVDRCGEIISLVSSELDVK
jgi:hypothetical protein